MSNPFPKVNFPDLFTHKQNTNSSDGDGYTSLEGIGCFNAVDVSNTENSADLTFNFHRNPGNTVGFTFFATNPSIPLFSPNEADLYNARIEDCYQMIPSHHKEYQWNILSNAPEQLQFLCEDYPKLMFGSSLALIQDEWYSHIAAQKGMTFQEGSLRPVKGRGSRGGIRRTAVLNLGTRTRGRDGLVDSVAAHSKFRTLLGDAICDIPEDLLLSNLHNELHMSARKRIYDVSYSGGALSFLNLSDDTGVLLHPTGQTMNELNFNQLTIKHPDEHPMPKLKHNQKFNIINRICQIENCVYSDTCFVAVRTPYHCHLFEVSHTKKDDGDLDINVKDIVRFNNPSSICLSPFIPGECVVALESGIIKLWTAGHDLQDLYKSDGGIFFAHEDTWRHCHYSAHPRILVAADRSGLQLIDCRTPIVSDEKTLFSLPSLFINHKEIVMATKQHPSNHYHHFLATQQALIMVDERFPQKPVLMWDHQLESDPGCMDIMNFDPEEESVLFLTTQSSKETHCFQYSSQTGLAPKSIGMPWKLAPPNSWSQSFAEEDFDNFESAVQDRLNESLLGMCVVRHNTDQAGFTALQLNTVGDVFYQSFISSQDSNEDKTSCPGPGFGPKTLQKQDKKKCKKWLKRVVEISKEKPQLEVHPSLADTQTCDATMSFKEMLKERTVHDKCKLCALCQSEQQETNEQDDQSDVCQSCGMSQSETEMLVASFRERGVLTRSSMNIGEGDRESQLPDLVDTASYTDFLSTLMMQTWQEGYKEDHQFLVPHIPIPKRTDSTPSDIAPRMSPSSVQKRTKAWAMASPSVFSVASSSISPVKRPLRYDSDSLSQVSTVTPNLKVQRWALTAPFDASISLDSSASLNSSFDCDLTDSQMSSTPSTSKKKKLKRRSVIGF